MTSTETDNSGRIRTHRELLERRGEAQPVLERNASRTETEMRIAQENIDVLEAAGAFRVSIPARFDGYQMGVRETLEISAKVAEGCGSTAWVLAVVNGCNWLASLLSDRSQQEIFGANPGAKVVGALNPTSEVAKVDGGFLISGRWPWASGSLHADWAMVGMSVVDESGAEIDHAGAFLPMAELSIEETWFVAGMRGTGSNTIVADEVFVPQHRLLSISQAIEGNYPTEHRDESVYRSAFAPFLSVSLVAPVLGLGRAALNFVIEKADRRAITSTKYERQVDSTGFQLQIARAATLLDTAFLHAFRVADEIDSAAAREEYLPYVRRARARADAGYAVSRVCEAIDILLSAHGASSFAEVSPLQRIWRDANTAARQANLNRTVCEEIYGKALLGIEREDNIAFNI